MAVIESANCSDDTDEIERLCAVFGIEDPEEKFDPDDFEDLFENEKEEEEVIDE